MWQQEIYFQAIRSRDSRFDGKFYYGVKTTGIFCRPTCPARPKIKNIELFLTKEEAQSAGYRPCKKCFAFNHKKFMDINLKLSSILNHALSALSSIDPYDFNEDLFAADYGITKRHLRRIFTNELGKTPIQILKEYRIQTALKMLQETQSTLTDVAYISGFQSLRRFNAVIKEKYKMTPSEMRKNMPDIQKDNAKIILNYKNPYDFIGLLSFYKSHQVGLLEEYSADSFTRIFEFAGEVGKLTITNDEENSALVLTIFFRNYSYYPEILKRIKAMFDVEFDPTVLINITHKNQMLSEIFNLYPGIRMPTGWDPFEVSIATILGQLVSVARGKNLVNDLINLAGEDSGLIIDGKAIKLFPKPEHILKADLSSLKTTKMRKQTLKEFCAAIISKQICLDSCQSVSEFLTKIMTIKGIGNWTADYIALRALRDTNAFPKTDLILSRALQKHLLNDIDKIAPWRAYVAAVFWKHYGKKLNT